MDKTVNATIIESIKKLLNYSLKDITYNYDTLTATEKSLITKDQFDELVTWLCVGENAQRSETVPNEGVDDGGPIDRQLSRIGDAGLERDIAAVVREALPNACKEWQEIGGAGACPACRSAAPTPRTGHDPRRDSYQADIGEGEVRLLRAVATTAKALHRELGFLFYVAHAEKAGETGGVVDDVVAAEEALGDALAALEKAAPCVSTDGNEQKGKVDHG